MLPILTSLLASLVLAMPLSSRTAVPTAPSPASELPAASAPLRLGIVGLSHDHVHWLLGREKRGDIEIVGIVEPDRARARRLLDQYGFSMDLVYDTMREMVEKTRPAAVAAFGSTRAHRDVVEFAAPRGIHVMVEKPLAASLADARRMKALADQHRIKLMVNYETTWYPTLYAAAEVLRADQIGDVRKVVVRDGHKGPTRIGVSPEFLAWLTDPVQNGGGALTDFGCYGANLMTFIMRGARPVSVTAVTQQLQPSQYPKVDDDATIIVTYPSAQAVIQASWNWPVGRKDMEIYGVNGYVMTDNRTQLRVRASEAVPEQARDVPERAAPLNDPFAYFSEWIAGRITPAAFDPSTLENNMLVMEILDAASRSAKTGGTIRL
jgi:predicted dehydrogenase